MGYNPKEQNIVIFSFDGVNMQNRFRLIQSFGYCKANLNHDLLIGDAILIKLIITLH